MTNALFERKLENIHSGLLERYRDTQHYSAPIVGAEREAVKKELLSLVLPPGYRVGSGSIVDSRGRETGQVDAVIEEPFSLSFPIATDTNRLYLADTVGAAFEIKSDLTAQGSDALTKIEEIRRLQRHKVNKGDFVLYDLLHIPCFIVAFKGPKKMSTLEEKFIKPRDRFYPNGVLVIESELFYGRTAGGGWYEATGKSQCILGFLSCVIESLHFAAQTHLDIHSYASLLPSNAKKAKGKSANTNG